MGHHLIVEGGAGLGIGFSDDDYRAAGAAIAEGREEIFSTADLIVKVKEPQPCECALLREHQALFAYLHLAADASQAAALANSGAACIAYETVTDGKGGLPLLRPMSEVAGRMSVQVGAHYLEKAQGGAGILIGGVAGVPPAKVVILGAGVAGTNAAQIACGMRADVTVFDIAPGRLAEIDQLFGGRARTAYATPGAVAENVADADMVVGAVLIPGAAAPKMLARSTIAGMKRGSVLIDVAIDQGGCFETSRPTTHDEPVYRVEDVTHYCVTNMPGAVPRTSNLALNNVTLPFVQRLASLGIYEALAADPHLAAGLNLSEGHIRHRQVAEALGRPFVSA
jgi:alanine dehydrogenase